MDDEERRSRLRDLVLGGLLGASAVLAAARRKPAPGTELRPPAGLAAFEDAPCYRETVEREAAEARARPRT